MLSKLYELYMLEVIPRQRLSAVAAMLLILVLNQMTALRADRRNEQMLGEVKAVCFCDSFWDTKGRFCRSRIAK